MSEPTELPAEDKADLVHIAPSESAPIKVRKPRSPLVLDPDVVDAVRKMSMTVEVTFKGYSCGISPHCRIRMLWPTSKITLFENSMVNANYAGYRSNLGVQVNKDVAVEVNGNILVDSDP
ncbi:hypothetical protein BGW42_000596 [Actinomortierella wolfii]|nr:hypothetical protein BGW42_000596 [Actinomortierella wolfii]